MATDLLNRDPSVVAEHISIRRRQTRVLRVFAARNRSGAWAYLDQLGWRRVASPTPAGARELLAALCRARLARTVITAEVTGTTVVAVTHDGDDPVRDLATEPRFTGLTARGRRRTDRRDGC